MYFDDFISEWYFITRIIIDECFESAGSYSVYNKLYNGSVIHSSF